MGSAGGAARGGRLAQRAARSEGCLAAWLPLLSKGGHRSLLSREQPAGLPEQGCALGPAQQSKFIKSDAPTDLPE